MYLQNINNDMIQRLTNIILYISQMIHNAHNNTGLFKVMHYLLHILKHGMLHLFKATFSFFHNIIVLISSVFCFYTELISFQRTVYLTGVSNNSLAHLHLVY